MSFKKTLKFGVLDFNTSPEQSETIKTDNSNNNSIVKIVTPDSNLLKNITTTNLKSSSISVGAGRRIAVSDVTKVGALGYNVLLDPAAMQQIDDDLKKILPTFIANKNKLTSIVSNKSLFPLGICRSAVFCRIVSLCNGKGCVRSDVIEFLADMLNAGIVPNFSSESNAGFELVGVISGLEDVFCYNNNGEIVLAIQALLSAELNPIKLSETEVLSLSTGQFFATGASCIISSGASNLMNMVDVISSLSCECIGVQIETFDSSRFEDCRPHRGQLASANNLRLLLDGSKKVNSCSLDKSKMKYSESFHSIPQFHGPTQDSINASMKSLEIELNSFESGSLNFTNVCNQGHDQSQSLLSLKIVLTAISLVTGYSVKRVETLSSSCYINSIDTIDFFTGLKILENFYDALLKELTTSYRLLDLADANVKVNDIEKKEKNNSVDNMKKPETDESGYTPAQKAKAEAARQKKAEKAALKNKSKEEKKSGASACGKGSTQLRNYLVSKVGSFDSLLNPFDVTNEGFGAFCQTLLEELNSGGEKRRPKIPKGARDYAPEQMRVREQVFTSIRRIFKRHGGVEIDTPVFELKELLTGKYGEDSKLIYDLADQGGELLSLRYDLTVPFARFLAMNSVGNIKRYHVAKVYRRDQPQLARGRYREFYQCDFDIAGNFSTMVPDAEVISVCAEILHDLPVGPFMIKLNHRRLLDAIFDICGVPMEKFRPICSAVDKLDKEPWEEVRREMVEDKGLSPDCADRIGKFVLHSGKPKELWSKFQDMKLFGDHIGANEAMAELKILFEYLDAMGTLNHVSFDLSLARGLDYYTGAIYEAVLTDGTSQVGSIAAGGRYDNLVGMFSANGIQTPCVGVSIGIERVFTIMEKKALELNILKNATMEVFIASIGPELVAERMRIANLLWNANISAEYSHKENPKFKPQLDEVLEKGIPFMIVFGSDELERKVVKIKNMKKFTEVEVALSEIVKYLTIDEECQTIHKGDVSLLDNMKNN